MFAGSAVNAAHSDGNQNFTSMGVIGMLGTSDVGGTALTLPFSVDAATGAAWNKEIGTPSVILAGGTFQSGTIGNINQIGTVIALQNGTITQGSIIITGGTLQSGTFTNTGTNVNVVTGSLVGTLLGGTLQNLNAGTITALGAGTITTGTVSVTIGTITGKDANAAAQTANPIGIGGTDSGGTIRTVLVNSAGAMSVTGASAGTFVNIVTGSSVGTILGGTLQNLVSGTINALVAGTITGGTLGNLNSGSIVVTNGTISTGTVAMTIGTILKSSPAASAGSFTAAGSVVLTGSQYDAAAFDLQGTWVGTTFFEGQIGTSAWFTIPAANAAGGIVGSATANGDYFVDMSSLDGVRARLTFSSGTQTYNARASAFQANTVTAAGGSINLLTTVSNLTNGSVILQSGTLTTGTLQNLVTGTINALAAGTITTGTVSMTTGTLNGGTLSNLNAGTITALATGTITGGTLGNLNYGTVAVDKKPVNVGTYYGTQGTTGAAVWGTLVSSVGAGNKVYVQGLDIVVVSGTVEVAVTNNVAGSQGTGVFVKGNFVPGGGISKNYDPILQTGTGGTIAWWMGGAGTVDVSLQYWVGA